MPPHCAHSRLLQEGGGERIEGEGIDVHTLAREDGFEPLMRHGMFQERRALLRLVYRRRL